MGFLLKLHIRNHLSAADAPLVVAGESPGEAPVASSKRVGRALHGEEEGVDQGGDGDHGDESENEFKRGQIDAAGRCREGRRWSADNGRGALHGGGEWVLLQLMLLSFFFSFFTSGFF
ncbi:hypothetical protein F2P56_007806 [Juglans regia]|uniref:Uncharacterized protein n=1 Tax=Juglans regia TaxID=51240 RepID=A0A833Y0N5_JUGRE|nr:hypothetical protein F2P56_007806 [Juglans regia]